MKSSQSEPSQKQAPLGEKVESPTKPKETWRQYGPNPAIEINEKGELRTKPDFPKK